jgi:hypothetical protein
MINDKTRTVLGAVGAAAFMACISAGAMAETPWQQDHPRRVEVNHRLDNLNGRIRQERQDGQISGTEASAMHSEAHQIRQEERGMAAANGSHITRGEQHLLNQQENAVSAQVGR